MKTLLLFSLLFTVNVFSQNNYTIQKDATIYDLPGGEFLTSVAIDDTIFIKHFDVLGNLIWQDSLMFSPTISPVYFDEITRFKNTNDYIISSFVDPTPNTPFWQSFNNDTLVYNFTKLNLTTHDFVDNQIDTFVCKGLDLVEIKDTSIFLMTSDYSIDPSPFNQVTYSLNPLMEISLIAPLDSVQTNPWGWYIEAFGDSIYKHQSIEGYHIMDKYSLQMSTLQSDQTYLLTSENFNSSYYKKVFNSDSLFVFTEGTSSGSYAVKWRMDWLNLSLSSINSTIINSPVTDQPPLRYSTSFYNSAIDRTNRKILIMSKDEAPIPSNIVQKIFIYDFNFNLVCEIPITVGSDEENSLIELNDLVYLRNDNSMNSELIRIDCSILALEEEVNNSKIEIFPNPTQSTITISNPDEKPLSIVVLSTDGKELMQSLKHESLISLELNHLPNGMYIIEIFDGSNTEIKRIIKE